MGRGEDRRVPHPSIRAGRRVTDRDAVARVLDVCAALVAAEQQDMVWGHAAVRDAAGRGIWIKRSGVAFDELTPDDIHLVDWDGAVIEGNGRAHIECFIHLEIMRVREDVMTSIHSHPPSVNAFSALDEPLVAISHEGVLFVDPQVPRSPLSGDLIASRELGAGLAAALADARACLMPRHGLVAVGSNDASATMTAVLLDRACALHLAARAAGEIRSFSDADEIREKTAHVWPGSQLQAGYDYLLRRAGRRD